MSRILNILKKARNVLADPDQDRWTQDTLLDLLSDAQKDICEHAKIFKGTYEMPLQTNQAVYTLPDYIWLVTRASYQGSSIDLLSHSWFDEQARKQVVNDRASNRWESTYGSNSPIDVFNFADWEDDTGPDPLALVYDRRNQSEMRVYPIPDGTNQGAITATVPLYGVSVDIDGDYSGFDSLYGVVTAMSDATTMAEEILSSVYGVATEFQDTQSVKLWYIRMPEELGTVADELVISPMWDRALRYYVIAHAFLTDIDTRNREKSTEYLSLYQRELDSAKMTDETDASRKAYQSTTYRTGFES